jgi:hypothetical protein
MLMFLSSTPAAAARVWGGGRVGEEDGLHLLLVLLIL